MNLRDAVREYNKRHPWGTTSVSYIAKKFGISRQALWQLSDHGGRSGICKYKEKFFEMFPEIASNLDFPKKVTYEYGKPERKKAKVVKLSEEDREMILNYPYLFGNSTLKKAEEGGYIYESLLNRHKAKIKVEIERMERISESRRNSESDSV